MQPLSRQVPPRQKKLFSGGHGDRPVRIFQPLPRRSAARCDLLRLIRARPSRFALNVTDRSVARPHQRHPEFPSRKRFARDWRRVRFVAAPRARETDPATSDIRPAAEASRLRSSAPSAAISASNRRIDSIRSPKNSMRTGCSSFSGKNIQDAAANRILADHLHRIALLVADALAGARSGLRAESPRRPQRQRELPVEVARLGAQQRRCDRRNRDRNLLSGQPPQPDRALLADLAVRRQILRAAAHRAPESVAAAAASRLVDQQIEERLDQLRAASRPACCRRR